MTPPVFAHGHLRLYLLSLLAESADGMHGYELMRFTGDTVSGDVFLDLSGQPDEVRVNTVSGSITTRLASGVAAQYKINTVSGRIQLDDSSITGVRGAYTGKYGNLDKQWLEFKANTVSGSVSVLHQVSA